MEGQFASLEPGLTSLVSMDSELLSDKQNGSHGREGALQVFRGTLTVSSLGVAATRQASPGVAEVSLRCR